MRHPIHTPRFNPHFASRGRDNLSVPAIDTQQRRLLERLREAGEEPVAFAELRRGGIDFPAAVVSELAMLGYEIERAYDRGRRIGVRLARPERDDTKEGVARRRLGPRRNLS
jgi:hypothetical protein